MVCPLCGRGFAESSFHPEQQVNDVEGVTVRGLGRGKGFSFSDRYSILNPEHPIIDRIRDRIRVLVRLLDVPTGDAGDVDRLRLIVEAKDRIIEELGDSAITMAHSSGQLKQQLAMKDQLIQDLTDEVTTLQARNVGLEDKAEEKRQLLEDLTEQFSFEEE